jgi:putative ABC transport system permease protein
MILVTMAVRNLRRHTRRTLLNLVMMTGGYVAIVIFAGFSVYILNATRWAAINNQFGHIQVAKKTYWNSRAEDSQADRALENPQELEQWIRSYPEVDYVAGRLSFYGMMTYQERSVAAQFVGFRPEIERHLNNGLHVVKGKSFEKDEAFEVIGGRGVMRKMNLETGEEATVLASTFDKVINAIDLKVIGVSQTGFSEIDDVTFYLPLAMAQRLLDTQQVDRLVVFLKDEHKVPRMMEKLSQKLPANLELRKWYDLADLYRQIENYYDVQNTIIYAIILSLVFLSIANTVGMSVYERTGEIGTMRALGDSREKVIKLFLLEGAILGLLGVFFGIILGLITAKLINTFPVSIQLPGASLPIPVLIHNEVMSFVWAFLMIFATSVLATWFPARKITNISITEALRHNI